MDEKDLLGLYTRLAAPYSYMDYPRVASRVENQEGDLLVTWNETDVLNEMAQRLLDDEAARRPLTDAEAYKKPEQSDLEKLLAKKELSVAETLDLYKRGLKPYFVLSITNMLVELTVENENDRTSPIKWLHPRIAEKIQTRYKEINDLVQEKGAAIRAIDSKIEDLKLRIGMLEEDGTDLIF